MKEGKSLALIRWYVFILRMCKLTERIRIVDEASSKLGVEREVLIPIDAMHRRIFKFSNTAIRFFYRC